MPAAGAQSLREALSGLPPAAAAALAALYAREPQLGDDGCRHPIDATTRIKLAEGLELIELLDRAEAHNALEIGLAYGFSTQFLLGGLQRRGGGRLLAIDPHQSGDWHGIGRRLAGDTVAAVEGLAFRCIEERSAWALPSLEGSGERFDLIFVDGYHRFDDVLLDVTAAARLCRPGGVIVLHDMWLPSVRAVVAFLQANRPELERMPCQCRNLAAFACQGPDLRQWDHFVSFATEAEPWFEEA
jgi:predicted O-methyltransferase YrrM